MSQSSPEPIKPQHQQEPAPSYPITAPTDVFTKPDSAGRSLPVGAWVAAGLVVLAIVVGLLIAGRTRREQSTNGILPLDPYAASLSLSAPAMSESESLSGGKSTFIDGHVQNRGTKTVTAATVQVFFRNDEGMPPRIETIPLSLIRTREPYIDTQLISAAPLRPGDDREFRLIFETLPGNWNLRLPDIHVVRVSTR